MVTNSGLQPEVQALLYNGHSAFIEERGVVTTLEGGIMGVRPEDGMSLQALVLIYLQAYSSTHQWHMAQ